MSGYAEPICGKCGHDRFEHDPVPILSYTRHGANLGHYRFGRCKYESDIGRGMIHCGCQAFVPHPRPHLAAMIGWREAAVA